MQVLEAMMGDEIFPDFKLLWMLFHQSRVETPRPEDCWLENWSRVTQVVGTRAREDLRNGAVYYFREPDTGGNAFAKGVVARLLEIRYQGKTYEVKAPRGIKDPNDWHKSDQAAFPEQFRKALEGSRKTEFAMSYSEGDTDARILDRFEPMKNARIFLRETFLRGEDRTLHHHRGVFHEWTEMHYPEAEVPGIRSRLYSFLDKAKCFERKNLVDFCPKRNTVGDAMEALQAIAFLPATVSPPAWIGNGSEIPAEETSPGR